VLYAYAQLAGTLALAAPPPGAASAEQARALHALRAALVRRRPAMGGGSMDIAASAGTPKIGPPPAGVAGRKRVGGGAGHARTGSLFGLFSPGAGAGAPASPGHRRAASNVHVNGHAAGVGLGLVNVNGSAGMASASANGKMAAVAEEEAVDPDAPLPTFEAPPAPLAVDLCLAPGETRTCEPSPRLLISHHLTFWDQTRTRWRCRTTSRRRSAAARCSSRTSSSSARAAPARPAPRARRARTGAAAGS
jgi:RAB6A-GEF complex partner protein 2